ncbi:acyl-CoA dehydrogenase family protein [Natronomonas salsuginis]|uniref:Acyl-CoA dehydrogenase n=1 Tax=Natronomonas salsuginis TaxID=2217661 RepID=A0A4U5JC90_9EURY|nr:acyl-CoA dehydrogenase family protein [Natronomonas salsuginis]TKR26235.1 acyl-CoA dehydrogenase [Natronomonas salsuginis]
MRFEPTDVQRALREEVRSFASEEVAPIAAECDRSGEFPEDVLANLSELGLTGLTLPEEYGGEGAGLVELVIAIEELSAAMMPAASALALHLGVATVVERFGTDEQRDELLADMASYDTVGALGYSEDDAGSDKSHMETTAERDGDEWVIDGHKRWVTNFFGADYVLTYAKTGPEADAPNDVSAFLVPTEAFEVDHVWDTLGARALKSPRVTLSNVRIPDDRRVGDVGSAAVDRGTVYNGVNVPARAVGIARAALEETIEYTADREQFDRPIGEFQGVRWRVAELARDVDAARLLTLRAADLADRGRDARRELAMAKIDATETAVDVTNEALQLHGGVGYTASRDVERYLRDARLLTIAGGPNELHRDSLGDAVYGGGN